MNKHKKKGFKNAFGIEMSIHDYFAIENRFEALREIAPAVSVSHLEFEEKDGLIYGRIKIRSLNLDFESEHQDKDLLTVYNYLEIDILDQINIWKKNRFQKQAAEYVVA